MGDFRDLIFHSLQLFFLPLQLNDEIDGAKNREFPVNTFGAVGRTGPAARYRVTPARLDVGRLSKHFGLPSGR